MPINSINGCIGCGTCVETCPTDVLRLDSKSGKAIIKYSADCQICHLCRMYCLVDAITAWIILKWITKTDRQGIFF